MSTAMRIWSKIIGVFPQSDVRHYVGFPPEITGGNDTRVQMQPPAALLIEQTREGFFLNRYSRDGEAVGDTWHRTPEEAKEQAIAEYGKAIEPWRPVPADVQDAAEFVIKHLER